MVDDADSNRPPSVESGSDPGGEPSVDAADDPAEPPADLPDDVPAPRSRDESTALLVPLKPSAVRGNGAAAAYAATHGERLRYASREEAERVAGALTRAGAAPVRLQAAAPQDPEGVDAYLVGASRADAPDPGGDPAEGWTFGVSANQLGAVGEALVLGRASPPPTLRHYVARELDRSPGSFELVVETETDPVRTPDGDGSWRPDCRADVVVGRSVVASYYCEVKTGGGRPERSQRVAMERAAERDAVLLLSVDVTALPRSYTVSVRAFHDDDRRPEPADGQRRLSDY